MNKVTNFKRIRDLVNYLKTDKELMNKDHVGSFNDQDIADFLVESYSNVYTDLIAFVTRVPELDSETNYSIIKIKETGELYKVPYIHHSHYGVDVDIYARVTKVLAKKKEITVYE